MKNQKKLLVLKYSLYTLLLLVFYVLQTVPGLFAINGSKPMLLVPLAVCIAMYEGEFVGGVFGAVAGLLCDVGGYSLFGYNGFVLSLCCIATGLLVIYLMRCNLAGCLLFSGVTLFVRGSVEFFFAFGMWGYDHVLQLYVRTVLPTVLYSLAVSPLFFLLVRRIFRRFSLAMQD